MGTVGKRRWALTIHDKEIEETIAIVVCAHYEIAPTDGAARCATGIGE